MKPKGLQTSDVLAPQESSEGVSVAQCKILLVKISIVRELRIHGFCSFGRQIKTD